MFIKIQLLQNFTKPFTKDLIILIENSSKESLLFHLKFVDQIIYVYGYAT